MWQKIKVIVYILIAAGIICAVIAGAHWIATLLASAGMVGSIFTRADTAIGLVKRSEVQDRETRQAIDRVADQVRDIRNEIENTADLSRRTTEELGRKPINDDAVADILAGKHNP